MPPPSSHSVCTVFAPLPVPAPSWPRVCALARGVNGTDEGGRRHSPLVTRTRQLYSISGARLTNRLSVC